VIVEVPNPSNQ